MQSFIQVGKKLGDNEPIFIAGPYGVENEDMLAYSMNKLGWQGVML